MDLVRLLRELQDPQSYPDPVERVEVRQTHISAVFLAGEYVYKVKKPVQFSFLDFSTLEKRYYYCHREVELNRRLAPDVYLDAVPIVTEGDRLKVDGEGEPIEWAVKMRRLPESALLENFLSTGDGALKLIQRLARRLADFHAGASTRPELSHFGEFAAISKNILDTLPVASQHQSDIISPTVLKSLEDLIRRELGERRALIEQRASQGLPCDAHGDLHLDHVYVSPGESKTTEFCIVDCIEFNDAFRYIDPIADVSFLIMDLKFHGFRDLATELANAYLAASGDKTGGLLLPLYVSYRAAVRAKVDSLQLEEQEIPPAEKMRAAQRARAHWLLALSELEAPGRRPCLVVIGGLPGTGKSTLAAELGQRADLSVIRSDVVRKRIAAAETADPSHAGHFQSGIYTPEWTSRTYAECLNQARQHLQHGQRVIVDATLSTEQHRLAFLNLAADFAVPHVGLLCHAAPEVVRERLAQRKNDASDADWDIYQKAALNWEPFGNVTQPYWSTIETAKPLSEQIEIAANRLRNVQVLSFSAT